MSTLKTKEEIFENIPELTDEDYIMLNEIFTPYLFFRDHKKEGYRECWCTRCDKHFDYYYLRRTEDKSHYEFIRKRHNEYGVCPKCGRAVVIKNCSLAKSCKNLNEWKRMVLFKSISETEVYLLCYFGNKEYQGSYTPKPTYQLSVVYHITPDSVRNFKCEYFWRPYGFGSVAGDFVERKSICEPFTRTYSYNWSSCEKRGYSWAGLNRLKNTFLKYAPFDLFSETYERFVYGSDSNIYSMFEMYEIPQVKFLCYYALYPSTERLLKVGLGDFVCSLVQNRPMKRFIDWNASTPKEMFRMNNAEFKEFKSHYQTFYGFKLYQLLTAVKKDIKYSTVMELIESYTGDSAVRVAQKIKQYNLNITHTFNYLKKNTRKKKTQYVGVKALDYEKTAIMWTDYITFAKELKYDLTRLDVLYPKNLEEAHGQASANIDVVRDEKAIIKYQSRYVKLQKQYEYSDGVFQIVIPKGVNDIVAEGSVLSHCVKGYAQRHMEGKTTILFMRDCTSPNTRLITIEIKDKTIVQNRGMKNRAPTEQEQAFIDKWIAWVQAGSKRPKKKKTASAA